MKTITMYTTHTCAYCFMAKRLFAKLGLAFVEVDVSHDHEKRIWLVETTRQRTVPQIFFGDEPIGGYSELAALDRAGTLLDLLADD